MERTKATKRYEVYLAITGGIVRHFNPALAKKQADGYSPLNSIWDAKPRGDKLGDFDTKELAFNAMCYYANSLIDTLPPWFGGFRYTLTKKRNDGLYVVFFDGGLDREELYGKGDNCIEFILLDHGGGDY